MTLDDIFDRCIPEPNSGCLLWEGPLFDGKYGGVYDGSNRVYVHRKTYELTRGVVLSTRDYVCHKCDTHLCVREDHLFLGSQWDNMRDMARKGRSRSQYSPDVVRQIRELWRTRTMSQTAIARQLGLPQTTVSQICRGARWGWLES